MQLSDDCFAFGGPLLSVDEAVALIGTRISPVAGIETVGVGEADGRVAALDVVSPINLPPFDNAAVDGYAVRHGDLAAGETVLPVRGRIAAGDAADDICAAGAAVRVFTGAPMPADADTVFMQEDVRRQGDRLVLPAGLKKGANRRLAGEDVVKGAVIMPGGRRLRPQDVALAAACGHASLVVRRRLRIALFSTGNELSEAGDAPRPGAIHDSNRVLLAALLARCGVEVSDLGILRDDAAGLAERFAAATPGHDLILTSGGVSTGEEDHVRTAVERVGRLVFWRLAIKPGRPVAMGLIEGTPFIGLPGNPVAVFVTFVWLVRPLLARLLGAEWERPRGFPVRAAFAYRKKAQRREYVRVSLRAGSDGRIEAVKFPRDGAGVLTSLSASDGLAELPESSTAVGAGEEIQFFPYSSLM